MPDNLRSFPKLMPLVAAGGAAVIISIICYWAMARGVGVTPDSIVYLGAAESIAAGKGVTTVSSHYTPNVSAGAPLTIFPPGYPVLIAGMIKLGLSTLTSAKWLQVLLMAATVFMIGIAASLGTEGSVPAVLSSILMFAASDQIWIVYTMAWSDSPFILFCLLALVLLSMHLVRSNQGLLIGASLAAGLAVMSRYVGVTVVIAMILTTLLIRSRRLHARIRDSLLILGVAGVLPAAWLIRNLALAGTTTARSFAFHLPSKADFVTLGESLLRLWFSWSIPLGLRSITFFCAGAFVLVVGVFVVKRSRENPDYATPLVAGTFATVYLGFLLVYNTFASPAVELDVRVLAPLYIFVNLLAVTAIYQFAKSKKSKLLWPGFLAAVLVLASMNASHAVPFVIERRLNGTGYASRQWTESATVDFLRRSDDKRVIYSNGIDAIGFLTGKDAMRLPARIDPVSWRINREFDSQMLAVNSEVAQNRAVVIYFDKISWRYYLPRREELENTYQLPVMLRLSDGTVYGLNPADSNHSAVPQN